MSWKSTSKGLAYCGTKSPPPEILMSQHLVQHPARRAAGDLHVQHRRKRWSDVIGRGPLVVSTGLNSVAHENDRYVRIVVVRRSVRRTLGAIDPVRLQNDHQVAATHGVEPILHAPADDVIHGTACRELLASEDTRHV